MHSLTMRFPGGTAKALTFSYDDSAKQDIRLVELFRKYKVKGTFNLNSNLIINAIENAKLLPFLTVEECVKLYTSDVAEVALHGATHTLLANQPTTLAMREVLDDRCQLENMFGKLIRGMAYPYGSYNNNVLDILRLSGIVYSRTVESHHGFALPKDWLKMGATCHHNDAKLMELAKEFLELPGYKIPGLFYLWGHSYEFDNNNNWNVMEEFLELLAGRDDIWYATNIEIYDYIKAFEQLIFSADGKTIYNPTFQDIWVSVGSLKMNEENKFIVPSGSSIHI